jgi:hypothetical protein
MVPRGLHGSFRICSSLKQQVDACYNVINITIITKPIKVKAHVLHLDTWMGYVWLVIRLDFCNFCCTSIHYTFCYNLYYLTFLIYSCLLFQ